MRTPPDMHSKCPSEDVTGWLYVTSSMLPGHCLSSLTFIPSNVALTFRGVFSQCLFPHTSVISFWHGAGNGGWSPNQCPLRGGCALVQLRTAQRLEMWRGHPHIWLRLDSYERGRVQTWGPPSRESSAPLVTRADSIFIRVWRESEK